MDYDKLIESLEMHRVIYKNDYDNFSGGACTSDCMDAALAIETLRAENKKLRAGKKKAIENLSKIVKLAHEQRDAVIADLARVTAERDEAIKAVKNMAEYIVCAGRVDYYLCDEIAQEHHLKYQPKNDGNYDNEPCYKCIADWFLQGHVWLGNCW